MIFVVTRYERVIVFIKCFSPVLLCFIFLDILEWKAFLIKPTVCLILTIDVTMKEIVNTTLNALKSNFFYFYTVSCLPKKSIAPERFRFGSL